MNLDASSGAPAPDSPESSGSMPVEQGGSNREGATAGYLATLPPWARELGLKYLSRTVSLFVLHGNVKDAVPLERDEGIEHVPLTTWLAESLFGGRDSVIFHDRSRGMTFADPAQLEDFAAGCG